MINWLRNLWKTKEGDIAINADIIYVFVLGEWVELKKLIEVYKIHLENKNGKKW